MTDQAGPGPGEPLASTATGSGPTVVLLHGLADDGAVWDGVVADLAADHRCVVVDLPGHGRSPTPADPAAYARDAVLDAVAAAVGEPDPAIVVGHSLGGYLALAAAVERSVATPLVLVATGPGFRRAESRERWNERVRRGASAMGLDPVAVTIAVHVDAVVIDGLDRVAAPVRLVVGADDDAYLGANDLLERRLASVRRTTVHGAGHHVMVSHPEVVAAAVRDLSAPR